MKFQLEYKHFYSRKCIWKCRLRNGGHFVQGGGGSADMPSKVWEKNYLSIPKVNGCTIEIWEWISSFILQYKIQIII